jgi:hypothetical protein
MSKAKMAHSISVSNCECCGQVHVELWRNGQMFAVAIPNDAATAERLAFDIQNAAAEARKHGGKPHVH